ncbi:GTP-binding protein REM 1-like [Crassostrea virginica]
MFSNMEQLQNLQCNVNLTKKLQPVERSSSLRIERPSSLAIRSQRRNSLPSPSVIKAIVHTPDLERVRSFSLIGGGLKNCGDKLRRRSTYSIGASEDAETCSTGATASLESICQRQIFKVAIIGSKGVGKKSLKKQFATSEELYINNKTEAYRSPEEICVLMDEEESWVMFVDETELANQAENELVDSVMVVFSVEDGKSFKNGVRKIEMIRQEIQFDKPLFLVANKVDLARHRVVTEKDAKKVATRYNCKYIETSVALNHNVDQLLAGVIRQVRSRRQNNVYHPEAERIEDSKTPSMFTKILLQKLMKIGHHDLSCTRLFDV